LRIIATKRPWANRTKYVHSTNTKETSARIIGVVGCNSSTVSLTRQHNGFDRLFTDGQKSEAKDPKFSAMTRKKPGYFRPSAGRTRSSASPFRGLSRRRRRTNHRRTPIGSRSRPPYMLTSTAAGPSPAVKKPQWVWQQQMLELKRLSTTL